MFSLEAQAGDVADPDGYITELSRRPLKPCISIQRLAQPICHLMATFLLVGEHSTGAMKTTKISKHLMSRKKKLILIVLNFSTLLKGSNDCWQKRIISFLQYLPQNLK